MSQLIRAELLKIRTTKMVWGMLALTIGFVLLQVALAGVDDDGLPPLTDPDAVRATYGSATAGLLFMMILGVVGITGEYRHRQRGAPTGGRCSAATRRRMCSRWATGWRLSST